MLTPRLIENIFQTPGKRQSQKKIRQDKSLMYVSLFATVLEGWPQIFFSYSYFVLTKIELGKTQFFSSKKT